MIRSSLARRLSSLLLGLCVLGLTPVLTSCGGASTSPFTANPSP